MRGSATSWTLRGLLDRRLVRGHDKVRQHRQNEHSEYMRHRRRGDADIHHKGGRHDLARSLAASQVFSYCCGSMPGVGLNG